MFTHTDDSATYSILLELQLATVIALSRLQSYQFGYFCSCNSPFQKNVWLFPHTQNPNGVRITLLLASAPLCKNTQKASNQRPLSKCSCAAPTDSWSTLDFNDRALRRQKSLST